MIKRWLLFIVLPLLIVACNTPDTQNNTIHVRVIADGKENVFATTDHVSVGQFLQQQKITVGEMDRLNPDDFTPITDNLLITIIRVREQQECKQEDVPFQTTYVKRTDLAPGTNKVLQPGSNGSQTTCYDVVYYDGVEKSRTAGNPTITQQPTVEIVAVGVDRTTIEPVPISGAIAYISDGQAHLIENNSVSDRVLQTGDNLDGRVFSLSDTGRLLLFTRKPDGTPTPETYNELWVMDTTDPQAAPVRLTQIDNVLAADWIPGQPYNFSYSTLQPRKADQVPDYQANNDLFVARLASGTFKLLKVTSTVKSRPTGVYGLWGTLFKWSPDGKNLAWSQSDGVGIVDFKAGILKKLFDFRVYSTTLARNWVWKPTLSWSADSSLLAVTVHGKPLENEPPESSPVFDLSLAQVEGLFQITLVPQVGMWAAPQYSPLLDAGSTNAKGYIAYLKARNAINSVSSEYDLVIADRDGSNERIVFPDKDKPGLKPINNGFVDEAELEWSPDGRQLGFIYQGDVWIVDAESGRTNQVTIIGNAHHLRWIN